MDCQPVVLRYEQPPALGICSTKYRGMNTTAQLVLNEGRDGVNQEECKMRLSKHVDSFLAELQFVPHGTKGR